MTGINNNLSGNSNYYNLNKNVVGYNNQLSQANNETLNVNLLGAKGGDSLTLSSNSKQIGIKIDANETEKSLTAKIDAECGTGTAEKLKKGDGNFWRKIFRSGYNASYPKGSAARSNGWCAKTDAKTTRTKLKNYLKKMCYAD